MEARTRKITNRVSTVAAVVAFVLQPIPGGDELGIVPLHYYLPVRLARMRRVPLAKLPWRAIQRIIWYGCGARLVGNFSLGLIPIAGAFTNSVTAIALTEFLGRYLDGVLDAPDAPAPEVTMSNLKQLFADALRKKKKEKGAGEPAAKANGKGTAEVSP